MPRNLSKPKTLSKLLKKITDLEPQIHSLKLLLNKKNNSSSSNYRPRRAITPDVLQSKDDECGSEITSAGATPTIEPGANHKKLMKPNCSLAKNPQFRTKIIKTGSRNFVLGTSRIRRIRHLHPRQLGGRDTKVHSYPGSTLDDLIQVCADYPKKKMNTVILGAGFNDSNKMESHIKQKWIKLISILLEKFQPTKFLVPLTISHFLQD